MADVVIVPRDNGPLLISGSFRIEDAEGNAFETKDQVALCRCGHSQKKPFCDGSHKKFEFQSVARAPKE